MTVPVGGSPVVGSHVLIVGINYAPELTGIAPYTTQIAEHLAVDAASVTVVAGPPSYPAWRVPLDERGWHRVEHRNGVEVHRLWHYVPSRQGGVRRALYELTFGAHVGAFTDRLPTPPGLIIAVVPSLAGAAAAARVAARYHVPLVVHMQDLMGRAAAQSGMVGGGALAGLTSTLEAWTLRRAARVAIVSEAFRPTLESYGVAAERIVFLPNWRHIGETHRDRNTVRRELGWAPGVTVALYTGNMGWKQDLGNVVEAARLSADRHDLLWVLVGDGSQRMVLEAQATGLPNLRFMPPCSTEDYPDVLAAADVLLLNERASVGEMSLPSKLTSYAAAGRPVVAAVPIDGPTAKEATRLVGATIVGPGTPLHLLLAVNRKPSANPRSATDRIKGFERARVSDLLAAALDDPIPSRGR